MALLRTAQTASCTRWASARARWRRTWAAHATRSNQPILYGLLAPAHQSAPAPFTCSSPLFLFVTMRVLTNPPPCNKIMWCTDDYSDDSVDYFSYDKKLAVQPKREKKRASPPIIQPQAWRAHKREASKDVKARVGLSDWINLLSNNKPQVG